MAESVYAIRSTLARIGALVDIPPGESSTGEDPAVQSYTLNSGEIGREPALRQDAAPSHEEDDYPGDLEPVFEWGLEAEQKMAALGAAAADRVRAAVQVTAGMDALGYYLSFHVRGAQWGATVRLSGIAWMVAEVFNDLPVDMATKVRLAFHAILQHELFHFATDVAISQGEISQQSAWWAPAKQARLSMGLGYLPEEERFANAWMLKAFRTDLPRFRVPGKQEALKRFVATQPVGYRDGLSVKTALDWSNGLRDLVSFYAYESGQGLDNEFLWEQGYDWSAHFPIRPRIDWRNCAIHLVDDSARYGIPPGWLTFFSTLSVVEESPSFTRKLSKLGGQIQAAWERLRGRVQIGLTPGHDFKRWPKGGPDIWSIRVNDGFRAHLRQEKATGKWIALDIGDHKSMGHG